MSKRIFSLLAALSLIVIAFVGNPVGAAAAKISLIRDAEIENIIRTYMTPVFQVAGLDPRAVKIFLVNDDRLNAFVAGGQNIFVNTGLLMKSKGPGAVIGVLAHEAGHIAHGDVALAHDTMTETRAQQILSMLLGAAAGLASGRGDVGAAVMAGGQRATEENYFRHSRTQEGAADAAAMRYLDATHESSEGLLNFLEGMSDQELLPERFQDPYLLTHPLTRDRIDALKAHVESSPYTNKRFPPAYYEMHDRMVAKLYGFMEPTSVTLRKYPESDTSLPARYARAIAYYRIPDLAKALPLINGLIAERPDDPYFRELKGQMLFENARPKEALEPLEKAVQLAPDAVPIRLLLARVQLELDDPAQLQPAITNLQAALLKERDNASVWRNLAIAYGRNGQMGESALALAEQAILHGDKKEARGQAQRALKMLKPGTAPALRAEDILHSTDDRKKGE